MQDASWLWWIPALPLLGSLTAGALHLLTLRARRRTPQARGPAALAAPIAVAAMAGSFAVSLAATLALRGDAEALASGAWRWIPLGEGFVELAMVVDRLSSVMTLVVTGVGLLIHVYAAGYMKGDPGYAKFFAFLNLFVAMMLLLVLSSSLLGLFIGWEGVGLCSYLLIGFWYEKGWPAEAAQKAFVVNRIGDACFLLGSFLLVRSFGTLDLQAIAGGVDALWRDPARVQELALAALLLFGGACGKSAQMPLFVWLPDAMAGPTPVSALIHAATMVTAGVYLVVRLNPLFAAVPELLFLVATVGALTALIAGSTALVQRDLKRVLAYSTVSQLGFMFLALGTGAFASAIFHLVTHAFFKALLFLGAGSVIHGMHDEQDMHRMGGLRREMPRTWMTFLCGAAALSGLPLLSGYFSKDEILAGAFLRGGGYYVLWALGVVTAALTATYTWRMVALTFHGEPRYDRGRLHPHESPAVMTGPLVVLAALSLLGGLLALPPVLGDVQFLHRWLEPVIAPGKAILAEQAGGALPHLSHAAEWALLAFGAALALFFAHRGFHLWRGGPAADERLAARRPGLARLFAEGWGFDRGLRAFVVQPVKVAAFLVAVVVDQFAIDGIVDGVGAQARALAGRARRMADGSIATYGLWMGGVTAAIALFWMWTAA